MRKKNKDIVPFPIDDDASEEFKIEDDHHVWCKTKLMHYVEQLSPKFKELMLLMYFTKPPEENLDIIAQKMKIDKKAVQPMAWSCRKKLAELVGQNLKDCEDTLFNHGIR
jgi:U3 small nucleolar ribonucleoprotein component